MKTKRTFGFLSTLLVAGAAAITLTGCKPALVDYAKGETPSQGLAFTLVTKGTEAYDGFKDYITPVDEFYIVSGRGTCTDKTIVVPETYEGKPVKGFGERAFFGDADVEGFILPNGVETLTNLAFGRTQIKVMKANGVRAYSGGSTGDLLMDDIVCSQVTEYLGQWAFFFQTQAKTIWLPKTLKKFGPQPFMDSSIATIRYEGSEADWKKIEYETGECDFPHINLEYNVKYPGIK